MLWPECTTDHLDLNISQEVSRVFWYSLSWFVKLCYTFSQIYDVLEVPAWSILQIVSLKVFCL